MRPERTFLHSAICAAASSPSIQLRCQTAQSANWSGRSGSGKSDPSAWAISRSRRAAGSCATGAACRSSGAKYPLRVRTLSSGRPRSRTWILRKLPSRVAFAGSYASR